MPGGRIDPARPFIPLGIAVLTISDSREAATDTSGDLLAERIVAAGHRLAARALVRDSKPHIQQQLRSWIDDPGVDVIISTGGTGRARSWKSSLASRKPRRGSHAMPADRADPASGSDTVEVARTKMLAAVAPLPPELIGTEAAAGRTLAETLVASRAQPPFRSSAMDGYGVPAAGP